MNSTALRAEETKKEISDAEEENEMLKSEILKLREEIAKKDSEKSE